MKYTHKHSLFYPQQSVTKSSLDSVLLMTKVHSVLPGGQNMSLQQPERQKERRGFEKRERHGTEQRGEHEERGFRFKLRKHHTMAYNFRQDLDLGTMLN